MRSLAAVLLTVLSVAHAADDAVVVTATRFPADVSRLPASATVLTAQDIAKSAARTLPELLSEQVGITLQDFFGNNASNSAVDLRGFGVTGAQNTLVLLDGKRLTDIDLTSPQWAAIPLAAIERIEILRGTGAVLYGDGATSGVINIVTRSPLAQGAKLEGFARAAAYNTLEGQLYGAKASGNFGVNGSVYTYGSDGYRANNRNEQRNNSAALRWGIGESYVDLRLATDSQDLRLPGARRIQPSIGLDELAADRRGAQTPLDFASRDGARAGLTLAHRVGEVELTLGLDWRDKDQRSYFDFSGFPVFRADTLRLGSTTPRARIPFRTGPLEHRLTVGADWNAWRYDSRRLDRPEHIEAPTNRVRVSEFTQAWYAQDTVLLSGAATASIGWREERLRLTAADTLDPNSPGFVPFVSTQAPPAAALQRQHAWELGLRYAFDARWTGFARANRSYRFVNVDEIYENDAFFNAQFQILRPQAARTQEAGAEWRAGPHFARAALFVTDVFDEIHLDPFTTGVGNTNLPPSRRQGLELEGRWQASPALQLSAAYAFTDARFLQGVLPGSLFAIGTNLDIAGKKVPLVPQHKLNLAGTWDLGAKTRLSGSLVTVSRTYMDNDEPNTLGKQIPGYMIVNFKLAREAGAARLALAVNNALDAKYYTYAVRSAFTIDRYAVYPLPGRTVGVTAEWKLE